MSSAMMAASLRCSRAKELLEPFERIVGRQRQQSISARACPSRDEATSASAPEYDGIAACPTLRTERCCPRPERRVRHCTPGERQMTASLEPRAPTTVYFEDIQKGDVLGSTGITITVDRDELLDYNRRYDCWPIH